MRNGLVYLKEKSERYSEAVLILLLILFYVTEAITKITETAQIDRIEFQAGLKAIVLVLAFIGLAVLKKKEFLYILILTAVFSIGQLTIPNGFEVSILKYFTKFIFPIALFGFFIVRSQNPKLKLLRVFEYVLLINSLFVLLGFLFEIQYFRTYIMGARFGYNGLMVSSAASTYFYIIGMCYFLAGYQKRVVENWRFWVIVIAGLIVGTKSIALALAAISLFYIIKYVNNKIIKRGFLAIISVGILGFAYYIFFINPIFLSIARTSGYLTSFLSFRDQLFMEHTLPYIQENWKIVNYLFGGVSNFELRPQMALIDTPFFWGIFGAGLYGYFYFKSYIKFPLNGYLNLFILTLILLITFMAGNFFYNASVVIYLIILRESFVMDTISLPVGRNKLDS